MEKDNLPTATNLAQLIKASRDLYGNETLFIALENVRSNDEGLGTGSNVLKARALCLKKCIIRQPRTERKAGKVSSFVLDPPSSKIDDVDEYYAQLVVELLEQHHLSLDAKEIRFPIGYVQVQSGIIKTYKNEPAEMYLHTEDGFPAVQLIGVNPDPDASAIYDILRNNNCDASLNSNKTFQKLGMDSLQIANFEFALKERFPHVHLPFGTCLTVNTLPTLLTYLKNNKSEAVVGTRIPKFDWYKSKSCKLSSSQRRFYFLHKLYPHRTDSLVESFSIPLDYYPINHLVTKINKMISRHTILRTIYINFEQFVCSLTESYFHILKSEDTGIDDIETIPMRISTSNNNVDFSLHHIMTDGKSIALLAHQFLKSEESHAVKKSIQYADYAAFENAQDYLEGLRFWKGHLNSLHVPELADVLSPSDDMSSSTLSLKLNCVPANDTETPFCAFLALYKILIYKLYGIEDYPVGIAVANRMYPEIVDAQGCFINTIVLKKPIQAINTIRETVYSIGLELQDCLKHQNVPFDLVVSEVGVDRSTEFPLFDVLFIMDIVDDNEVPMVVRERKTCLYKQMWYLKKIGGQWSMEVEYHTHLYRETRVAQLTSLLKSLMEDYSCILHRKIRDLSFNHEQHENSESDFPLMHPILAVEGQIKRNVTSTIEDHKERRCLTEVHAASRLRAISLCDQIIRLSGEVMTIDSPVVLYLHRNLDLIETILAVWQLGGTVVPISRDWPEQRVLSVINSLGAYLITDSQTLKVRNQVNLQLFKSASSYKMFNKNSENDLLYMTYTSGSTGQPKAVCTEALGLLNLIMNYNLNFYFNHSKSLYQVVNYGFDIFFADILQVLFNGGNCRLAEGRIPRPHEMEGLTHAYVMPAYLSVADTKLCEVLCKFESIQFGGEHVQEHFKQVALSKNIPLYLQFGLTEHTVYSHVKRVKKLDIRNDIGRPFTNYKFKITDKDGCVIPNGFKGYFNSGGVGLMRGYFGSQEPRRKWLNSGDIMSYDINNLLLYGRDDSQVKLMGHRVELGEIETAITSCEDVAICVVDASPDLRAYIVLKDQKSETSLVHTTISAELENRLPHYMVPQQLMFLEKLPQNSNGKIDRIQLSKLQYSEVKTCGTTQESSAGTQNLELVRQLMNVFSKYIKFQNLKPDENIFHCGANSLQLLLAIEDLKENHGAHIELRDVFKLKTIQKIANRAEIITTASKQPKSNSGKPQLLRKADYNQQAHWFLARKNSQREDYLLSFKIQYNTGFNLMRFAKAINAVISTHHALRTIICARDNDIYQSCLSRTECFIALSCSNTTMSIDITTEVPVKVRLNEESRLIVAVFHHVAVDGTSLSIITATLAEAYNNGRMPQRLDYHFSDYLDEGSLSYWTAHLGNVEEPALLPYDYEDVDVSNNEAKHVERILNTNCQDFVSSEDCSALTIYIAAYALLFKHLSHCTTVTVGVPFANRSPRNLNVVGNFVTTLCLKINTNFEFFADFLTHVNEAVMNAHSNQSVPFERVVQEINPNRSPNANPLFSTMFVLYNNSRSKIPELGNCKIEVAELRIQKAKFDVTWFVEGEELCVEYNSARFKESTIKSWIDKFIVIFNQVLRKPSKLADIRLGTFPQLKEESRNDYPDDMTMGRIFKLQALRTPENQFVKSGTQKSERTYHEALLDAVTLAQKLQEMHFRTAGETIKCDDVIGICYPEGIENHLGILACLLLGCAYVPLDPDNPIKRNREILADSGAVILLSDSSDLCIPTVKVAYGTQLKAIRFWPCKASYNLAYIIYTSGTTGKPKGVCIQEKGVINTIENVTRFYCLYPAQTILQYAKYSFDASIAYTFGAIANGSTLTIKAPHHRIEEKLGLLHMTPVLLQDYTKEDIEYLRNLVEVMSVGGDVLPDICVKRVTEHGIPLIQVYGPTEATILQCMAKMKSKSPSGRLLGRPISNFKWDLLPTDNSTDEGELLMAGPNLARGYRNYSTLSKSGFSASMKDYHSGDIVRRLPSGHFIYQYRRDRQKKVRGYRVDLSEVEANLSLVPDIGASAADYVLDDEVVHIAVYFTGNVEEDSVRRFLHSRLPHYMQPSYFFKMSKIPVNTNTKVDRAMLPKPEKHGLPSKSSTVTVDNLPAGTSRNSEQHNVECRNLEESITAIWKRILKTENLNGSSNFFAVGGHSVKAALICRTVQDELNMNCPVELIFENPTLFGFVSALKAAAPLPQQSQSSNFDSSKIVVNPYQSYMLKLYLNEANVKRLHYNNKFHIKMKPPVDRELLQVLLNGIVIHQTALRSLFRQTANEDKFLAVVLSGTESFISLREASCTDSTSKICPFKGPLYTVCLSHDVLTIEISHVIEDGQSLNIMAKQLTVGDIPQKTYNYYESVLQPKEEAIIFWKDKLKGFTENKIQANPFCRSESGTCIVMKEFSDLTVILKNSSKEHNCSAFAVALDAFICALRSRIERNSEVFAVGVPIDLRRTLDEQETVGYYVNSVPIVVSPEDLSIEATKRNLEEAYLNRNVPLDMISNENLFNVMFAEDNFNNTLIHSAEQFQAAYDDGTSSKFPFTMFISFEETVQVRVAFRSSLFHREYIEALVDDWKIALTRSDLQFDCTAHTVSDIPQSSNMMALFCNQSALTKELPALCSPTTSTSYGDTNAQVQLQAEILKTLYTEATGELLNKDSVLPIVSSKSIETTILCLAVMCAGAAYAPIDENNPHARVEEILEAMGSCVYISRRTFESSGRKQIQPTRVKRRTDNTKLFNTLTSTNLAYVINTSGTQGSPKAVTIEHRSIVNLAVQSTRNFAMTPSDSVYHFTNFAFDNSVLEYVMALTNGAQLFHPQGSFTADNFVTEVRTYNITHALLFPGLVSTFTENHLQILSDLRYWIVGAEKIPQNLLNDALEQGVNVIQNYGPTESTAYILWRRMKKGDFAQNLGAPIDNAKCFVAAPSLKTDTLLIGGIGLLRGYLNTTKQPFIVTENEKFLPTSDLVQRLPSGEIVFVGRNDTVVKIRGHRVDLMEVEQALQSLDRLKQAKVVFIEEQQKLNCYYTTRSRTPLKSIDLLNHLKKLLPVYMLPSSFIHLEQFPLTSNAKIDTKQLTQFGANIVRERELLFKMPSTPVEYELWKIWNDAFASDKIGVTDDFFLLGGNSLIAENVVNKIRQGLSASCTSEKLYQSRTIEQLARVIGLSVAQLKNQKSQNEDLPAPLNYDRIPISYQQEQMLFLHAIDEDFEYNMPFVQHFSLNLDVDKLHKAFHRLIQENAILRTVIIDDFQQVQSMTEAFYPLKCNSIDLCDQEREVLLLRNEQFDLSQCVLRFKLFKTSSSYMVVMVIHHIATDATTTYLIERKLSELYNDQDMRLKASRKQIGSYSYFAVAQKLVDFSKLLDKAAARLEGHLNQRIFSSNGNTTSHVNLSLPQSDVFEICSAERVTPNVVFMSLLYSTIRRLFKKESFLIGCPVSGRSSETAETIGYFLNNVVIVAETSNLQKLRKQFDESMQYSEVPFNLLVSKLNVPRTLNESLMYEIYFNCRYGLESESALSIENTAVNGQLRSQENCKHPLEIDVDQLETEFLIEIKLKGTANLVESIRNCFNEEYRKMMVLQDLKRIISKLLKINPEQFSEEDNIFDIGGTSLLLLKLRNEMIASFGKSISVNQLIANQRIADMASIAAGIDYGTSNVATIYKATTEEKILVFLPSLIGGSLAYGHLYQPFLSRISNASVLALNFPSPIREESMEDLCRCLAEQLKRYLSQSAQVTLIGASFGGILCYEIARQMHLPLKIISIDATANTSNQQMDSYEEHKDQIAHELRNYDVSEENAEQIIQESWKLLKMSFAYTPSERIKNEFHQLYITDPSNGWDTVADVQAHKINGCHSTMLLGRNAESLADLIASII